MPLAWTVIVALLLLFGGARGEAARTDGADGRDERLPPTNRPTVEAAFPRESHASGDLARLVIWTRGAHVSLQLFRAGTETENVKARDVMLGTPVTPVRYVGAVARGRVIPVRPLPGRAVSISRGYSARAGRSGMRPSSCARDASARRPSPSSSRR